MYYYHQHAQHRMELRDKRDISGGICTDWLTHCCCPCCAVCQEAHEVNAKVHHRSKTNLIFLHPDTAYDPPSDLTHIQHSSTLLQNSSSTTNKIPAARALDFCSGESLESVAQKTDADDLALSAASRVILKMSAVVAALVLLAVYTSPHPYNVGILALIFLQPAIILYFVYWRKRRSSATLDGVVKMFAVGFWATSVQSMVLESVLQGVGLLLLSPLGPVVQIQGAVEGGGDDGQEQLVNHNAPGGRPLLAVLSDIVTTLVLEHSDPEDGGGGDGEGIDWEHQLGGVAHSQESSGPPTGKDPNLAADNDGPDLTSYTPLVVLVLFLTAFVVAAGVEETTKHFAVRCCNFPRPLRDPHSILVYLVASALGFATFENIGYVFGVASDEDPDSDYYTVELVTLLLRVLLPVHFICAVLQASQLSKVSMNFESIPLFWVLFPAILVHGAFDFVLFLGGYLGATYALDSVAYQVTFLAIPLAISTTGAYLAYNRFGTVQRLYEAGWQSFQSGGGGAGGTGGSPRERDILAVSEEGLFTPRGDGDGGVPVARQV
jgi:RsiW-degrading membrane proteinase PrsW (M82 family)